MRRSADGRPPVEPRAPGESPAEHLGETIECRIPHQRRDHRRAQPCRGLSEIELGPAVSLVGRDARLAFQERRRGVVHPVVEDDEVRAIARLELADERDDFLRADIADLGQVPDLDSTAPIVELACDQRRDRAIVARPEAPERRPSEHQQPECLGLGAVGRGRGGLPGEPQPLPIDRDGLSRKGSLAEVDVGFPAILESLELAIVLRRARIRRRTLPRRRADRAVPVAAYWSLIAKTS